VNAVVDYRRRRYMAGAQTPEQTDAIYRARAEVRLLVGKYERRLKTRAEQLVMLNMLANPQADPEEVGREAFAAAGRETGLISESATRPALSGPAS
jgi:hypothetical protein